jgi:hypothetical protein
MSSLGEEKKTVDLRLPFEIIFGFNPKIDISIYLNAFKYLF